MPCMIHLCLVVLEPTDNNIPIVPINMKAIAENSIVARIYALPS
jgi:hypothetical protein